MKLTLAEPKYLKDSISIISELVTEANFKITKNAVELVAMDPANVAMVIFKLVSSSFVEYKLDQDVNISINLSNFKQILGRAKPNDTVSLELDENMLKVQLKGTSTRTFSLPIIEFDEKEQRIPDLSFPLTITTDTTVLTDAIEDVDVVAESVSMIAEKGKFIVSAEGDLSKANVEIPADDVTNITLESDDKVKAKYSIEYLKKIIKGGKLSNQVTVQFNKDYPLKVEYKAVDKVLMSFILAPRVDND